MLPPLPWKFFCFLIGHGSQINPAYRGFQKTLWEVRVDSDTYHISNGVQFGSAIYRNHGVPIEQRHISTTPHGVLIDEKHISNTPYSAPIGQQQLSTTLPWCKNDHFSYLYLPFIAISVSMIMKMKTTTMIMMVLINKCTAAT